MRDRGLVMTLMAVDGACVVSGDHVTIHATNKTSRRGKSGTQRPLRKFKRFAVRRAGLGSGDDKIERASKNVIGPEQEAGRDLFSGKRC